jgi:CRISPR system Cascade subunit CasC
MFIEIHAIQNFAPSNLNRDDTGSPKDCEFGGHRRARVSSQCWKRAVREYFQDHDLIPEAQRAVRTKNLVIELAKRLRDGKEERTQEQAMTVAAIAVEGLGVGFDAESKEEKKTNVLLFLGRDQIESLASVCHEHWDTLSKKKPVLPKDFSKRAKEIVYQSSAVDLALFGRMIATKPPDRKLNVDAACQVAHALSTHRVAPEFDYYTAVDDLGREDETGAGMVGTQEFNSACFYRYANIDFTQLQSNLRGDRELALSGVRAFLESFIMSIPKAKQNSTAAQNLPSFVMIVVRDKGLASLANAFVRPVDGRNAGLMVNSVDALAKYWVEIRAMYGANGIKSAFYAMTEKVGSDALTGVEKAADVQDLLSKAISGLGGA